MLANAAGPRQLQQQVMPTRRRTKGPPVVGLLRGGRLLGGAHVPHVDLAAHGEWIGQGSMDGQAGWGGWPEGARVCEGTTGMLAWQHVLPSSCSSHSAQTPGICVAADALARTQGPTGPAQLECGKQQIRRCHNNNSPDQRADGLVAGVGIGVAGAEHLAPVKVLHGCKARSSRVGH